VFVTMPSGTARWFVRKIKDIHCLLSERGGAGGGLKRFRWPG
jgi:hypothetical protein